MAIKFFDAFLANASFAVEVSGDGIEQFLRDFEFVAPATAFVASGVNEGTVVRFAAEGANFRGEGEGVVIILNIHFYLNRKTESRMRDKAKG